MGIFIKDKLFKQIIATLLSVLLGGIIIALGGKALSAKIIGTEENFYLKYYFATCNRLLNSTGGDKNANSDIVIVDVSNYHKREEVAPILEKIHSYSPRVIALDIFYQQNPEIIQSADDRLIQAIYKVQDVLISPAIITIDNTISLPFYAHVDSIKSVKYSIPLDNGFYSEFSIDNEKLPDDYKTPFALSIAQKYHNDTTWSKVGFRTNYIAKFFSTIESIDEIDSLAIKDKIVIIGDCNNHKDLKDTPFPIHQSSNYIAGTMNIAYIVNTLISNREHIKKLNMQQNPTTHMSNFANLPLYDIPLWINILLAIVMVFTYISLYCRLQDIAYREEKIKRLLAIIAPLMLICYEIILILLSFLITFTTCLVPDLLLFMSSIIFAITIYQLITTSKIPEQ